MTCAETYEERDMLPRNVPGKSDGLWGGPEFKEAQYN